MITEVANWMTEGVSCTALERLMVMRLVYWVMRRQTWIHSYCLDANPGRRQGWSSLSDPRGNPARALKLHADQPVDVLLTFSTSHCSRSSIPSMTPRTCRWTQTVNEAVWALSDEGTPRARFWRPEELQLLRL